MFYFFLLAVAAAGGVIYFFAAGLFPGLKEERFGVLEPLPSNLGEWEDDTESAAGRAATAAGKKREVRLLFQEGGLFGQGRLTRQARLRDAATGQILEVQPEETVVRRRIRQRA
ncbi:MAG TPA: hypothetical protein VHB79_25180 [Polyangiaceae bacterium]|nr:hypothetical protein [Polyangiaceae bacterium]